MAYAQEFTPELDDALLKRLELKLQESTDADAGRARGEAIARGLGGDVYEASAVGLARRGGLDRLADLQANYALQRAGMQREERLMGQDRDFTREGWNFEAGERAKDRSLQERLAQLGYAEAAASEGRQHRWGMQDKLWKAGASALNAGLAASVGL